MSDLLTRREIEKLSGIPASSPVRQRNRLLKQGIHCVVNGAGEVVIWRSWVDQAALPKEFLSRYIPKPANDDDEEIGMNLSALNG